MTRSQEHIGPSGNGIVFVALGIFAAVMNRTTTRGGCTNDSDDDRVASEKRKKYANLLACLATAS
jgi:hypothetical protein